MRPLLLALIERVLQPHIRLDLALCGLQSNQTSDVESRLDLDL